MRSAIMTMTLLTTITCSAAAGGFKTLARELSNNARRAGIQRVAVLPFEPGDDGSAASGWTISERLVTQLVRAGRVQAVERSLLKRLMEEQRLGATGAVDARELKRLGRLSSADGIVTGSFVTIGRDVVVQARLIHLETGVIVAACERRIERDWFDAERALFVPAPEFIAAVPRFVETEDELLRDVPAEPESCEDAAERVDAIERDVLDLKARYWALKLRRGLDPRTLKANPGSTITDPGLKREFYARLKEYHARPSVPELSAAEVRRFVTLDGRAFALAKDCGI